jgi:hypothetical protein
MKFFNWSAEKNEELKKSRNISFEEIILAIYEGHIIDIYEHPNKSLYQGQRIYVVDLNEYLYLVPFVETEKEIFLKTIIPSRKAVKKYKGGQNK